MKVLIARVQRLPVATKLSLLRLHDSSRLLCEASCGRLKWERRRHRLSGREDVAQRHCFKKNTTSSRYPCKLSKSITTTAIASMLVLYWISEIGLVVYSTFSCLKYFSCLLLLTFTTSSCKIFFLEFSIRSIEGSPELLVLVD